MPAKRQRASEEPETLQEALVYFADKAKALQFFVDIRWPEGVTCPYCEGKKHSFISTRQTWACATCKQRFSVKVGTLMEDSPIGLDKWIGAIWLITNAKNGISSHEAGRALGVTQKTAWFLLHRIRMALQQGSFEKLSGEVEVDETYIGGKARNMHKNKRPGKVARTAGKDFGKETVMGMMDRSNGEKPSRVVAIHVPDNKGRTMAPKVREHVEPGSALFTDCMKAYAQLEDEYQRYIIDHAVSYVDGNTHTNSLENFWALLKRGLKGTYVSVEPFHLFRYLDEQTFRFNERKDNDQGRFKKAAAGIVGKRLTYKQLTGKDKADAAEDQATA